MHTHTHVHTQFLLLLFALLSSTTLVVPATATPQAAITPPSSYYLRSHVVGVGSGVGEEGGKGKDGLWVSCYGTGPGRADLTLQPAEQDASPAFFNSGYQEFDLDPPEPFGVSLGRYGDGGTGWNFLTTAPGYGDGGFFFNDTGLQFGNGTGGVAFGGWLACDWWHGVPQLFWRDESVRVAVPGSCARVELVPVAI